MKRAILVTTAFAVLACLSGLPLMAQARGGGMGQGPAMGPPGTNQQGQPMGQGPTMGRQPGMENGGMDRGPNARDNMPPMGRMKTPDQLLSQNPQLSNKLQTLLPAGENVQTAAAGFKNLGQFAAAVHISHNLNIPFEQFKGKVTSGDSLGKAVHTLNPNLSHKQVKAQVKKGKHQAKADIKASHS